MLDILPIMRSMEKTVTSTPAEMNNGQVCATCYHLDTVNQRQALCRAHPPTPVGGVIGMIDPVSGQQTPGVHWDSFQPRIGFPDKFFCHEWKAKA